MWDSLRPSPSRCSSVASASRVRRRIHEVRKCAGPSQLEDASTTSRRRCRSWTEWRRRRRHRSNKFLNHHRELRRHASTYVINSSTVVTNLRQSATTASLALGENVRIVASSTIRVSRIDRTRARDTRRSGQRDKRDTITVTGPNASADTILVSTTTTYTKSAPLLRSPTSASGHSFLPKGPSVPHRATIDAATLG